MTKPSYGMKKYRRRDFSERADNRIRIMEMYPKIDKLSQKPTLKCIVILLDFGRIKS